VIGLLLALMRGPNAAKGCAIAIFAAIAGALILGIAIASSR